MGRAQLIRNFFWGLIFIRLLRLLAEPAHIWDTWLFFGLILSRWSLSIYSNFTTFWDWWSCSILPLCWLFRLLFFWLFIFRRNRVQYSWWLHLFFVLSESCNIYSFPLILGESLSWIFEFIMKCSPMPLIRLNYPLDVIERYIEPLFSFFSFVLFRALHGISVLFAHLISDLSLILALLNQSQLLFKPPIEILKSS